VSLPSPGLLVSTLAAASFGLVACHPSDERSVVFSKDVNGMLVGDAGSSGQQLIVGVGDSVAKLVERNPFMKQFGLGGRDMLRLPISTTFDLHYDDNDLRLDVGCVRNANVDGNTRFLGVTLVGMTLCEPPLNDWRAATEQASLMIRRFEQQNPHAKDLRAFVLSASENELQAIAGKGWRKSSHDLDSLLTLDEANAKFSREAAAGHEEILSGRRKNTLAIVGLYAGAKALFEIGISKTQHFGGTNLTDAQRRTLRYEVTMSFRLRSDVELAPAAP